MKNSVIEGIFNGVKGCHETMALKKINKENLKEISEGYDTLKKHFNANQIKDIDKFLQVYEKSLGDEITFYFTEGFKLGLLIAVECFEDNE